MAQYNIFENFPLFHFSPAAVSNTNSLFINGVVFDHSVSLNTINVLFFQQNLGTNSITVSFGIYSLNGASLSLQNSGSTSTSIGGGATRFLSFTMSAAENLSPGNWYFGIINSQNTCRIGGMVGRTASGGAPGGVLVDGVYSASQTVLAASYATSDFIVYGDSSSTVSTYPYILISA